MEHDHLAPEPIIDLKSFSLDGARWEVAMELVHEHGLNASEVALAALRSSGANREAAWRWRDILRRVKLLGAELGKLPDTNIAPDEKDLPV